jgi:hypothetical protein
VSALLYLEHFSDADLALLAAAGGHTSRLEDFPSYLRANPEALDAVLRHPALFHSLFGPGAEDALLRASPFLVFAALISRAAHDLEEVRFVEEWIGPGRRVPMFEVSRLREFAGDSMHRLFLAEVLASYTHVASGSFYVQTARGWRRRRFSELDPMRLLELLDVVPEPERPALYRRLGDLSLFLTGVFPDYAGTRVLPPLRRQRLRRVLEGDEAPRREESGPELSAGDVWLLERLGGHSYRVAWKATEGVGGMARVLGDMAQSFGDARRLLNVVTDRYLFPFRERWFPVAG